MKRWPGYYDVVILPDARVRDYAIGLSRQLRRHGKWVLGKRSFLPHISLYHIPVRATDLEPFIAELQDIVNSTQWGTLQTTGFDMPLLMTDKPEWLRKLQRRVVQRTAKYFDKTYGAEDMWSLHRFSGRRLKFAKRYLKEFGSPMIGMNFRPHITLTSFKDEDPGVDVKLERLRFTVDRLYLCELGESHSCQKILRQFS